MVYSGGLPHPWVMIRWMLRILDRVLYGPSEGWCKTCGGWCLGTRPLSGPKYHGDQNAPEDAALNEWTHHTEHKTIESLLDGYPEKVMDMVLDNSADVVMDGASPFTSGEYERVRRTVGTPVFEVEAGGKHYMGIRSYKFA